MEILLTLMYYFKEFINLNTFGENAAVLQGNFDTFYFFSVIILLLGLKVKEFRSFAFESLIWIFPLLIWALAQCLIIDQINVLKLIVNLIKVYICLLLFIYMKNTNYKKLYKVVVNIGLLFSLSIIPSLIFRDSFLWRHNDFINAYNNNRLQLFYTEPSELGFHVSFIIIFMLYFIIQGVGNKKINIFVLMGCILILYLAQPFGSIASLSVAIFVMLIVYFKKNINFKIIGLYVFLLMGVFIGSILIIRSDNSIYLRLLDTLAGTDLSNSYRIGVSNKVLVNSLLNSNGIGVGFGNLNTDSFRMNYSMYGLFDVLANSFPYFIIESGIIGIAYISILIVYILKKSLKKNSVLLLSLFAFVISYQIFGGHFTNSTNWIIYGILANNNYIASLKKEIYDD